MNYSIPSNVKSGIYRITAPGGYYYIGSAKDFKQRYQQHYGELLKNKHYNYHLQSRFNKYPQGWSFDLIVECENLLERETEILREHFGRALCMNLNKNADRPNAAKRYRSPETIAKAAATRKRNGYKHSEETKAKMRGPRATNGHEGMKHSEETKAKIKNSLIARRELPKQMLLVF